jgi:CBS domain containing-hemolysin-like protein
VDVDPLPWTILASGLLLVGFVTAVEAGLISANRSELRKMSDEGNGQARLVEQLLHDPGQVMMTILLLRTAAVLVAGAAIARLLPDGLGAGQIVLAVASVWLVLALIQTMIRGWVQTRTIGVSLVLAPVLRVGIWLLMPVTALQRWLGKPTQEQDEEPVEEALRSVMRGAEDEEPILDSEKEMIASILEMDETVAREVMVPRIDIVAIDVETSLREALAVIIEAGHSRIPVYAENIDQIVGFLYAKDLLTCFQEERGDVPVRTLLRPVSFVPASKKVNTLLREMQRDRIHIVMVVDEYGGTAGLVTIEDILEEIVGEIQDEYDAEEETYIEALGPSTYLLNARIDLYSLAKLLDAELPEEDADTLGGLIYSVLGHVPERGEAVDVAGWRFTVLTLEGRRIAQVRAEPVAQASAAAPAGQTVDADGSPAASSFLNVSASD